MRFLALALILLVSMPTLRAAEDPGLSAVPDALRSDLQHQRWGDALTKLEVLGAERADDTDLWLLLAAVAHHGAGRHEEALGTLRQLEADHPGSPWTPKARFRRADIHRARGEYEEAEAIYEDAVRHLRSPERQGELAQVYLDYADDASTTPTVPTPGHRLDHDRAFALYAKVLELEAPRELRDRALFRMAVCQEATGNWDIARQRFELYLAEFDPARQKPLPANFVAGARVWKARLRLGRAELAAGRAAQARRTFEDLAADLTDSIDAGEVAVELRELVGDARYDLARTYGAGGNGARLAIAAYGRYLDQFPAHTRSTVAAFAIAELQRGLGLLDDAATSYGEVTGRDAPATEDKDILAEHAMLTTRALFLAGVTYAADQRQAEAIERFEAYTRRHPDGPDWAAAQQGIVDARFQIGALHRRFERYDEARAAWLDFLAAHPLDRRAAQIAFDLGQVKFEQALRAREEDDDADVEALWRAAIAEWGQVVTRYPGSEEASRALYQTGLLQETELGELEAAITTYRTCTFGRFAGQAQARLAAMTKPSLELFTERSWRTDEPARVKLLLRNVEEVEVERYALDLEAYFRKHLTHRHVEDLDLDLIAPDHRAEVPVEGYARYAPIELDVDLDVEGPGVWAVAVTAGELRATTLVIRSDVDVIVKSSRREVFVFAQDVRGGAAAQGVSVLVALPGRGGEPTLEELVTAEDGVARLALEGLKNADEVRVLAVREGHYASDGMTLSGLSLSQGLSPRGHVSTDRTAYRPGDRVRWRGIVRAVKDGAYHFSPGKRVDVEVRDSQGRPFLTERMALSDFGTVHGDVTLPDQAPLGEYVVQLSGPGLPKVAGTFTVQQYQLQKVELTLEPERGVVYRGEEVKVTARAAYYYGEPLVDSPLAYQLPDGRVLEARTDANGQVEITFDTRDFLNEGGLYVGATLREEDVSTSTQVWLATRGFRVATTTPHDVVLAGDSFPVAVHTSAPDGEDVGRELVVELLRRESVPGGLWREVVLDTRTVTTDAEDGHAHLVFAVEEGGNHHVRAAGTDRFGNPVTSELTVFVSGDEDSTRLRLLAESTRGEVGDALAFELVNRAGPGLALLTFEGESIIGYRLVQLTEGRNALTLDLDHEHFPNLRVAAAMMRTGELHQASAEFEVARELRVQVSPSTSPIEPGAEATVDLVVTDQLGRPVSAELALAVVDASLFDLYPDHTPALRAFFEGGARRSAGLRTTSSCTFAYHGVTVRIDQAILDEARREAAEVQWKNKSIELKEELASLGYIGEEAEGMADGQLGGRFGRRVTPPGGGGGGPATPGPAGPPASGSDNFFLSGKQSFGVVERGRQLDAKLGLAAQATASAEFDADTAFWTPAVVTDDRGRARVTFALPEKATRWHLTTRGVSAETLLGEATGALVTRSDFFVELDTPIALSEGDQPRLAARVHNLTGATGTAELTLTVRAGDQRRFQTATVELGEASIVEHRFEALPGLEAADLELELAVKAQLDGDEVVADTSEVVPVYPWGLELRDAESGALTDARTIWLELPEGRRYEDRRVELYVGPSVDRVLIEEALGRAPYPLTRLGGTSHAAVASELVGACAVLESMRGAGRTAHPQHATLRAHAQGLVASLAAAQNEDGGWTWIGRGASDSQASARVALGLSAAREAGLQLAPLTLRKASDKLAGFYSAQGSQQLELRAALVHALAALGKGDFSAANTLHRERNRLSPAALAHTALALVHMKRAPMAAEVAAVLEASFQLDALTGFGPCSVAGNSAWSRSPLDMTALATLALERALPSSTRIAAGAEWLLEHRPWYERRGRGLAVAAVARFERETERRDRRATLTAVVGDGEPMELALEADGPGHRVVVHLPGDGRRVPVRLSLEGSARPHVSAVLTGFTTDMTLPDDSGFRVVRATYAAEAPRYRGKALPVGFGVLRDRSKTWTNTVEHLELGRTTDVRVLVHHDRNQDGGIDDYLVLEVPLPGGARVLEESVSGGFGQHEQRDGRLVVPLGTRVGTQAVTFTLLGVDPGEYRLAPPVLRSAYRPERLALGGASDLAVLARGEASSDEYRPTPDELFALGKLSHEDGDLAGAHQRLTDLYARHQGNLRTQDLATLARVLLTTSLHQRDPASAVRFFEVLRDKDPSYTVPFDQIIAVGEAYRDLGEFERAYLIFRATALETFGKDLEVAGTLEDAGERAGALDVLDELTLAYPDLPSVVETRLALADRLLALAPEAHTHPSLVQAEYDRAALTQRGILLLQRFLALHPDSSLAPDAGLGLVSAYLGMDDPETAAELAGEFAALHTEPRFADAFLYTRAVAQWHLGQEDEAKGLLTRIAGATYPDERGNQQPSDNRDLALYILGQIAHARQDSETAEDYYDRVAHLFADAKEALDGFRRRALALEEVTTTRPGEAVAVPLTFQNLEEAELLVYAVDLMTLYLREKDLSQVTAVNLAGIAPTLTTTVKLGEGRDLREQASEAKLALSKPGAYLVIARAGALHASGLVLVSDLELEVASDPTSGRVRVQAIDRGDGSYQRGVDVRVVGSRSGAFVHGETDPRGLFLADGVAGAATVVARDGDHYAFHRGQQQLGAPQQELQKLGEQLDQQAYFQNVIDFNEGNMRAREENLMREIRQDRAGVQLQKIR